MKIALIGYGKMGREIEKIALEQNHKIVCIIDNENDWNLKKEQLEEADVAIDFSTPDSALGNIKKAFNMNIPLVMGTTGWYEHIPKLKNECLKKNQAFLYATNFSIGVNIFFLINSYLANLMNERNEYDVALEETHHTQKLDAPSGTAISLAKDILFNLDRKSSWVRKIHSQNNQHQIEIKSNRIEDKTGIHKVIYESEIDSIEIKHSAKNRKGFANGAITAAEWIVNNKGWFEFKDILFENID
jgi:4-hydroxy-tetrahydrodipicolinate reductase